MEKVKTLIYNHLKSKGFKRRLFNWYLPTLKVYLAKGYTLLHGYLERRYYTDQYQTDKVLEEVAEAPAGAPAVNIVEPYDRAVEIIRQYQIGHDPQYMGTCVAETIKNSVRLATKIAYGKTFDLAEGDIYIDRETLPKWVDGGMYPDRAFKRVAEKGIAIAGIIPTAKSEADLKKTTRKEYPDADIAPYRIKPVAGSQFIGGYRDFETVWAYITNEYAKGTIRPFQASITSYRNWWGTDIPKPTGPILGAHSIVGVTIPFTYGGERAFFVIDSAYNRGTAWRVGRGIRIVTESTWRGLGNSARKIKLVPSIESRLNNQESIEIKSAKVTSPGRLGQKGEHISRIQQALIKLGYRIPAGPTAYYGSQTATAVQKFQTSNWRKFADINPIWTKQKLANIKGKSFGNLSVKVINTLL